jgi:formate dehydrogenase assembly factor FdhD
MHEAAVVDRGGKFKAEKKVLPKDCCGFCGREAIQGEKNTTCGLFIGLHVSSACRHTNL